MFFVFLKCIYIIINFLLKSKKSILLNNNLEQVNNHFYEDQIHNSFSLKTSIVDATKTDNNVTTETYYNQFVLRDVNDLPLATFESSSFSSGRNSFNVYSRNYNTSGESIGQTTISGHVYQDGTTTINLSAVDSYCNNGLGIIHALNTWETNSNNAGTSGTTYTLQSNKTYLMVTGHNSTPGANTLWIIRLGGNTAFCLGTGNNQTSIITVTCSNNNKVTVKASAGLVNVSFLCLG